MEKEADDDLSEALSLTLDPAHAPPRETALTSEHLDRCNGRYQIYTVENIGLEATAAPS